MTLTDREALPSLEQAQIELAIAQQLFQQTTYYINRSLRSVNSASPDSVNRNSPHDQQVQDKLCSAYFELLGGMEIVAIPFENPILAHMIEAGKQHLNQI